jgi:hypothetical protein
MRPGPEPRPERVLRDAAILFAAAVEAEGDIRVEWDLLRKSAIRYAQASKHKGRPRKVADGAR